MSFADATQWQLFTPSGARKYVSQSEWSRFLTEAAQLPPGPRGLCLLVAYTGCRISEALALTSTQVDAEAGAVILRTLKRRRLVFRSVPIPNHVRDLLLQSPTAKDGRYWTMSRTTAWRLVKRLMLHARISGAQACPRGLRHGFGVRAASEGVPPSLIQRWLGHSTLAMTTVYTNAVGTEERSFAARTWRSVNGVSLTRPEDTTRDFSGFGALQKAGVPDQPASLPRLRLVQLRPLGRARRARGLTGPPGALLFFVPC